MYSPEKIWGNVADFLSLYIGVFGRRLATPAAKKKRGQSRVYNPYSSQALFINKKKEAAMSGGLP